MTLQALLVSTDDAASDVLGRVLPTFGIAMDRSSDHETTLARIQQQKFDALIVDFDNPELAERRAAAGAASWAPNPLSIALVADTAKVRGILSGGAHFVLYKPITEEAAKAGLRAAAALLSRERRRAVRVPVQAAVEITLPDDAQGGWHSSRSVGDRDGRADGGDPESGGVAGFPLSTAGWRREDRCPRAGGVGESEWANWSSLSGSFRELFG